jgi:hypothetical protein
MAISPGGLERESSQSRGGWPPPDASADEMERLRVALTNRLMRAQRAAQAYCEGRVQ